MIIGIPKEIMEQEHRVAVIPETVKKFVNGGHQVFIEKGAGEGSYFMDEAYREAGAIILDDVRDLYQQAQLILKVKEPLFHETLHVHEIDLMHDGQYLITFLHPASPVNHEMVNKMAKKGVKGLTLDGVPRISRAQSMDALTSMSTCAGYKGVIMASDHLTRFVPQIFTAVGMIKPAKALVIGAGVAGLQAIATAKRLGAVVYSADIRPDACEQAKSLGAKIIDLKIPAEIAVGTGGYAKSLPKEYLEQERNILSDVIGDFDIVILSALIPGKIAPTLITEEMVQKMKPGSVIVDISIDQGGNCEITTPGQIVQKHHVIIQGIKNIPGQVPTSSTWLFAQNIYNLANYLIQNDQLQLDLTDDITSSILVTDGDQIVHKGTLEAMGFITE